MQDILVQLLVFSYAATGAVGFIGYLPTIKDLYYHRNKSANNMSYFIWTICTFITFLYALFILDDLLFRIMSAFNLFACTLIFTLSVRFKPKNATPK